MGKIKNHGYSWGSDFTNYDKRGVFRRFFISRGYTTHQNPSQPSGSNVKISSLRRFLSLWMQWSTVVESVQPSAFNSMDLKHWVWKCVGSTPTLNLQLYPSPVISWSGTSHLVLCIFHVLPVPNSLQIWRKKRQLNFLYHVAVEQASRKYFPPILRRQHTVALWRYVWFKLIWGPPTNSSF